MIVSYSLAIFAAVSNAGSNVLQRTANEEEHSDRGLSARLLWELLRNSKWLAGMGLVIASFLLQAAALGTGELAAVEPLIVLELPLTLLGARLFLASELHVIEWSSIVLLTAGLGALVGLLHPHAGRSTASDLTWFVGATGTALVIALLFAAGRKTKDEVRAGFFGAAGGVAFGLTAAFMKAMTGTFSNGIIALLTTWQLYAMIATGAVAMLLVQSALQAGKLVAAQPGLSLLDPFTSIAWGIVAFGEKTAGGLHLWGAGLGAMIMVVGVVLLTRSPVLQQSQQSGETTESAGTAP